LRRERLTEGAITALVALAIFVAGGLVLQDRWTQIEPYIDQTGLFTGDLSYVPVALYGLTLSPGKGLLVFAPPVLAGLAGLYLLYRQRRAEALLFAALPVFFLWVYSVNTSWHGGASWGPRYLLPVLPFEGGPAFLQEIHFDPALSPVTGHLGLATEYLGNLAAGRNHFEQVPFGREPYLQYFREAKSLDFTIVHLYEWLRASR
jgi:hypothetical protein